MEKLEMLARVGKGVWVSGCCGAYQGDLGRTWTTWATLWRVEGKLEGWSAPVRRGVANRTDHKETQEVVSGGSGGGGARESGGSDWLAVQVGRGKGGRHRAETSE